MVVDEFIGSIEPTIGKLIGGVYHNTGISSRGVGGAHQSNILISKWKEFYYIKEQRYLVYGKVIM